jgi:hypothetical protein
VSSNDSVIRFFAPDQENPRRADRLTGADVPLWRESFAMRTTSPCYAVDFMADGAFFAAGGAHLMVWKAQASSSAVEGFEGLRYQPEVDIALEAEPLALLSFAPDGRFLASAGLHGFTVTVWFEGSSIYGNMNCLDLAHPAPPVYVSWWNNEVLRQRTDVLTPVAPPQQHVADGRGGSSGSASTAGGGSNRQRLIPNVLLTFAQDGRVRLWQETDTSESLRFFVTAVIDGSNSSPPTMPVVGTMGGLSMSMGGAGGGVGGGGGFGAGAGEGAGGGRVATCPLLSAAWMDVHHPLAASDSAALPVTFGGKRGALPAAEIMALYARTQSSFPPHRHGTNGFFLDQVRACVA